MSSLSFHCKALAFLDLYDCERVTNDGVLSLARGCSKLEHLDIGNCRCLTLPLHPSLILQPSEKWTGVCTLLFLPSSHELTSPLHTIGK